MLPQDNNWNFQKEKIEFEKQCIRERIRNANLGENVTLIPAKPTPSMFDGNKKVAIYTRVSTSSMEQVSSIENQTKYYTERIEKTPNLEMVGMYVDEGKSGTSTRKRDGFNQMIKDAESKKFDVIMCASVSRFARNISDAENYVKRLKTKNPSYPVAVMFETENIYTLDPNCEDAFHLHSMLAAMESRNKSRRMILSYDQRICTGQFPVADLLGYRHTKDGQLIIQEDEALTVRFIFLAYLNGYSCEEIASILTAKQRKTLKGRTEWNAQMVRHIMSNERRWGDLHARKTIVIDYETRKTKKNNADRYSAFVQNHHEAIVSSNIAKTIQCINKSNKRMLSGIPDLKVIKNGALKGFISISPAWGGINSNIFIDTCKSIYTDEEYQQIQHEAKILSGEEYSNILDMSFNGYEVPLSAFFISQYTPTLTISKNSLAFNKATYKRFLNVDYVEVLYHPILQMIMVRPCSSDDNNAICWLTPSGKPSMKIGSTAFTKAIFDNTDWIEDYRFRFRGIYREREGKKALFFYLDEPQILKDKKDIIKENSEDIYIQYKKTRKQIDNNIFGFEYVLKKDRYQLPNNITANDIAESGTIMENPSTGVIPTKIEIKNELNNLLKAM